MINTDYLTLDEATHIYHNKDNIRFTSVSQFTKKYTPSFDSDKMSKLTAIKTNKSQQEVLDEWAKAAKDSIVRGNQIHKDVEEYLKYKTTAKSLEDYKFTKKIDSLVANIVADDILPEQIVYDPKLLLVGTADLILRTKAGNLVILDWKTNKEIKKDSPYGKMLPPFDFLDNCNFNHYSIQLNIYAYLAGWDMVKKLMLVHFDKDTMETKTYVIDKSDRIIDCMLDEILGKR